MNEIRFNQVHGKFLNVYPLPNERYTNQEIMEKYSDLQSIMKESAFEKQHAEILRDKDLTNHFQALAIEHGLDQTETYLRFIKNFNVLGYTIATFKKGLNGEKLARRSLKLVSLDPNVRILYNIQLQDEDSQTEYDAIVIAPYGIFVIEVKNWNKEMVIDEYGRLSQISTNIVYDIPGKMCTKKALLKECLGDLFPDEYYSIMLFPEEKATCTDNYKKIPLSFGSGVSSIIQDYNYGDVLSKENIDDIVTKIESAHKEQYSTSPVNCEQLIDDFAKLMVMIEEKIAKSEISNEDDEIEESDTSSDATESFQDEVFENETIDNDDSSTEEDDSPCSKKSIFKPVAIVTIALSGLVAAGYALKKYLR